MNLTPSKFRTHFSPLVISLSAINLSACKEVVRRNFRHISFNLVVCRLKISAEDAFSRVSAKEEGLTSKVIEMQLKHNQNTFLTTSVSTSYPVVIPTCNSEPIEPFWFCNAIHYQLQLTGTLKYD